MNLYEVQNGDIIASLSSYINSQLINTKVYLSLHAVVQYIMDGHVVTDLVE